VNPGLIGINTGSTGICSADPKQPVLFGDDYLNLSLSLSKP
jgi:hypothetical protein